MSCDYGSLTSYLNDPKQQWADAGAEAAWQEMVSTWWSKDDSFRAANTFASFLMDFFHGKPEVDCGNLADENCASTINCGSWQAQNAAISSPAGYLCVVTPLNDVQCVCTSS